MFLRWRGFSVATRQLVVAVQDADQPVDAQAFLELYASTLLAEAYAPASGQVAEPVLEC